jgi:hypothetical protein
MATLEEELRRLADLAAGDDDDSSPAGRYSTERAADHALMVEELKRRGIPAAVAGDLANELASQFLAQKGSWPTVFELLADPTSINRQSYTQSGLYALPPAFGVRQADGSITFYRNDPLQGLQPVTGGSDDFGFGLKDLASSRTPIFDMDEIQAILASSGFGDDPGPGPRGPGATLKPPAFDRDHLLETASNLWRGMLLTEPGDIGRIVDDYTAKATSFLMNEGGRLDFETFVLGRIRDQPRYRMLYQNKAPGVTEQAHLGQYVKAVQALGFADRRISELAAQGAQSGASEAGFTERLSRSPEFVQANQGAFSQKFANTIAQLGIRGT